MVERDERFSNLASGFELGTEIHGKSCRVSLSQICFSYLKLNLIISPSLMKLLNFSTLGNNLPNSMIIW